MKALSLVLLGFTLAAIPQAARPVEADWSLKLKLGGLAEGERDLGRDLDPLNPIDSTEVGFIDANGSLLLRFSPELASYVRLQGYLPSGEVYQEEDTRVVPAKGYGALRELWLEYGGLTSYPGEVVRLGLQRVREADALWWDRDIESFRWIFDTTLLQWQLGVAQQFETYRTDDVDLSTSQEDRLYGLAGVGGQWTPGNFAQLRAAWASDRTGDGDFTPVGAPGEDPALKNEERNYGWVGLNVHNGYYDYESPPSVAYWAEGVLLTGTRERLAVVTTVDPVSGVTSSTVTGRTEDDVQAFGGDVGLRFRPGGAPFAIGAAYAYGQGGRSGGESETFEQTGLHSNRSRFTGTRSTLYRFNEALRPDLSNLHVATGYFSVPAETFDLSAVFHHFERDDDAEPIDADGIDVDPVFASSDIGNGYDVVAAWYFGGSDETGYGWGDDLRNNLRVRGSLFQPGDAYGSGVDDQYRAVVEVTLWF